MSAIYTVYCTCIKFHVLFCFINWKENCWDINFRGHGSVVGTIIVRFAKYASYCGLIFINKGILRNPQKFIYLENFYVYGINIA